jgi:hypothetical protein
MLPVSRLPCKGNGVGCIKIGTQLYRQAAASGGERQYIHAACGLLHGLEACCTAADTSMPASTSTTPIAGQTQQQVCKFVVVASGWFYLGMTLSLLGDNTAALQAYWSAHKVDRTKPVVLSNLGSVYSAMREWKDAANAYVRICGRHV